VNADSFDSIEVTRDLQHQNSTTTIIIIITTTAAAAATIYFAHECNLYDTMNDTELLHYCYYYTHLTASFPGQPG